VASDATGLSGIAGRYATALYDLADEQNSLDAVADDLRGLKALIGESSDLRHLLSSPLFDRNEQTNAALAVLEAAGVSDLTRRFVGVVGQNRRLFALDATIDEYLRILATRRGEVTAQVTSARPLTESQVAALTEKLRSIVGNKVNIEAEVDESLLGGLVVRVGSRMVDTSIRSKIQRMGRAMRATA
jgi:F-type H+-transporting ATPase subunit delta